MSFIGCTLYVLAEKQMKYTETNFTFLIPLQNKYIPDINF